MIDSDTSALDEYMAALGQPQDTPERAAAREAALQAGLRKATFVPLSTMRIAARAWAPMLEMARLGNIASRSDLEVGARCLETGIWGAHRNVVTNLTQLRDDAFRKAVSSEADTLAARARARSSEVLAILEKR